MISTALLRIKDISIKSGEKNIIHNLSLTIHPGEIHALMGPNGSGKSTLAYGLMGHPEYTITNGQMVWEEQTDLLPRKVNERAALGMFLSFQNPQEIAGVSLAQLLALAQNKQLKNKEKQPAGMFIKEIKQRLQNVGLSDEFVSRSIHENASGGEKKRLEMLQMMTLQPRLAILDEIDSGLDIDALKTIAANIKRLQVESNTAFLIITHYQRILRYLKPDQIHVLIQGRIVQSGNKELADRLEEQGYRDFEPAQ